jgi:hypothetical protein
VRGVRARLEQVPRLLLVGCVLSHLVLRLRQSSHLSQSCSRMAMQAPRLTVTR